MNSLGASCENSITVRSPRFEYNFNDVAPYADKPLGQDAVSDSMYSERTAKNYGNLARGLAVATQLYQCLRDPGIAARIAHRKGPELLRLWQTSQRELDFQPIPDDLRTPAPADEVLKLLRGCVRDCTTTLYAVQVGSFANRADALARVRRLAKLVVTPHNTTWDSTRIVDWWNWSCGGDHRPELYVLAPEEAPGPGYKVLHGLFIERREALAARDSVRARFELPALVVRVVVTGPVLRSALHDW